MEACVLCGGTRFRPYHKPPAMGGAGLERCEGCSLLQMRPMPSAAEQLVYYQHYDVLGEREPYYAASWGEHALKTPEGRDYAARATWMLGHLPQPQSVLDVGTGPALFVRLMQQHGVPVSAVELNARAAERVARERGVPVHAGTLFDLPEPAVPYGAITLWDVLEHVGDPAALVRRAHSLLAPSGWFFLETPDESSLLDRAVMATAALGMRAFADGFYGMHHLVLFRPATARRLLEEAGFELREMVGAETTVERSFRSPSLKDKTMRVGLGALFVTARLLGRRNKLLIAAQKRPV